MNQSLNGQWKFCVDPHRVGETRPGAAEIPDPLYGANQPGYDDADWITMPVPSHWQSFGINYNGAAWYRRTFAFDRVDGERVFLNITAVDYFCDAWLNGYYLGSHEGFFAPMRFEVTDWIKQGTNSLAILVDAPPDNRQANPYFPGKQQIKGAIADWDANDTSLNPGGLWGDVTIERLATAHIESFRASAVFNDDYTHATLSLSVQLDSAYRQAKEAGLSIQVEPRNFVGKAHSFEKAVNVVTGAHDCMLSLEIPEPALWYCAGMGDARLYNIVVSLTVDGCVHALSSNFGFREIRQGDGWAMYLNGRRLYLKGANYLSDQLLSTMDESRYAKDIDLALGANMNVLRPFCVVEKEEFYRICDERGLMIYQDFPIQWSMSNASELVRRACAQTGDMIRRLHNHPCVIMWCFGSEPNQYNFEKLGFALAREAKRLDPTRIVNQANSWYEMMDFNEMKQKYNWRVDNHFYPGWYYKTFGDMYTLRDLTIDKLDLVSEFGAQALPNLPSMKAIFRGESAWPIDARAYKKRCCQTDELAHWTGECESLEQLIDISQRHQAKVLRFIIEYLRSRRFETPESTDPCNNGALLFLFNDCRPMITWSIVDYYRETKQAYDAVKAAFAPLLVGMNWPMKDDDHRQEQVCLFAINETANAYAEVSFEMQYLDAEGNVIDQITVKDVGALGENCMLVTDPIPLTNAEGAVSARVTLVWRSESIAESTYDL